MRVLLGVLIFLGAAAAADIFLFDGRYTRAILGYFNISWVSPEAEFVALLENSLMQRADRALRGASGVRDDLHRIGRYFSSVRALAKARATAAPARIARLAFKNKRCITSPPAIPITATSPGFHPLIVKPLILDGTKREMRVR